MTTTVVSNASQLTRALSAARSGDTISLSSGNYGDLSFGEKVFDGVTITSADPAHSAVFHSINIWNSSGLNFAGVNISLTPTATSYEWSTALKFSGSSHMSFVNGKIEGGLAINGVAFDAPVGTSDASGNIKGVYTGYGVSLYKSDNIVLRGNEIAHLAKGVVLTEVTGLEIRNNEIHHMRTGMISGTGVNSAIIDGNTIYSSNPHNFSAAGDHADFIHLWTDKARQSVASQDIQITNNLIKQGDGQAILGIFLEDNDNLGFRNVLIDHNVILNGNFQGLRLENVFDSKVTNNVLLQTTGTDQESPSLLLRDGSHNVQISNNTLASISDLTGSVGANANLATGNHLVQRFHLFAPGYYSADAVHRAETAMDGGTAVSLSGIDTGIVFIPISNGFGPSITDMTPPPASDFFTIDLSQLPHFNNGWFELS